MPRRRRRNRNGRRSRRPRARNSNVTNQNAISRFAATAVYAGATATGAGTVIVENPLTVANLGARVVAILDNFMYWRMVALEIDQWVLEKAALTNDLTVHHALAFTPMNNTLYTAPTTFLAMADFPEFRDDVGSKRLKIRVNRSGLMSKMPTKWLLTTANDNSQSLDCAGTITTAISSDSTDSASITQYFARFIIECCGPIDPADIPLMKKFPRRFGRVRFTKNDPGLITQLPSQEVHVLPEEKQLPGEFKAFSDAIIVTSQ